MSEIIIFPTDTVYGIGCKIFDKAGIKQIYEIKHRSYDKPLACLCFDLNQIHQIAVVNLKAEKLIKSFLPGPLTLILKAKEDVKEKIGYDTIGVRIPNNLIALEVLKKNGPMLTTSVNESGEKPLNSYLEIKEKYGDMVHEVIENHYPSSNLASTVVSLIEDEVKVLREGFITLKMIKDVLDV